MLIRQVPDIWASQIAPDRVCSRNSVNCTLPAKRTQTP